MAMTGPADLSDVRRGDVLYWREQDMFGVMFQRLTVTEIDADAVHLVNKRDDPHVFDRATAQVRWPDGLGRSYLEAPGAETDSDYDAFVADQRLRYAAHELSRIPASVTRNHAMRSDEVERLEAAITAWKLARAPGEGRMRSPTVTTRSACVVCGTPMRRTWTQDLADYQWHAEDGSITGIADDVPAGAPADTPALLDLLAEAGDMEAYSSVLARYELGDTLLPWEHRHRAIEPASQIAPDDVPECHGWPMRAAPGAWICRIDGAVTRTDRTP